MFEYDDQVLLVDLPNGVEQGFVPLSDRHWKMICENSKNVCGFFFTHDHPDHCDKDRLYDYLLQNPQTPVFMPEENTADGKVTFGPFTVHYYRVDHAPLPEIPPHVSARIEAGGTSVYVSGDAKPASEAHTKVLDGCVQDAAFWTSVYLSQKPTRELMARVSLKNYIYHMPLRTERDGMWKKAESNFRRYAAELEHVMILGSYPAKIKI